MNTETTALARQLVESGHWRIMDGMRLVRRYSRESIGARVVVAKDGMPPMAASLVDGQWRFGRVDLTDCIPDLDDPATLGCVEQIARDALGADVMISPIWSVPGNVVDGYVLYIDHGCTRFAFGATRAAALVAAILAAPGAR